LQCNCNTWKQNRAERNKAKDHERTKPDVMPTVNRTGFIIDVSNKNKTNMLIIDDKEKMQ
jgi:hypothetical protein